MNTIVNIAVLSFALAASDSSRDSSYEKIMMWNDTSSNGDIELEMQRYREGPRQPDDDLQPTYYNSPWNRVRLT